jgi:septal ring factor EnvC (AmiA/AmiB activator)
MKKTTKETIKKVAGATGTILLAGVYIVAGVAVAMADVDAKGKKREMIRGEINGLQDDINKIDKDIESMESQLGKGMSYADYDAARRLREQKENDIKLKKSMLYNI